jgi:hypothetical protein
MRFTILRPPGWLLVVSVSFGLAVRCVACLASVPVTLLALLKGGNLHGLSNPGAGAAALFMFGRYD